VSAPVPCDFLNPTRRVRLAATALAADDGGSNLYIIGPELTFAAFCLAAVLVQSKQRQAKTKARAAPMDEGPDATKDETP
jgi:hypothetical protein